MSFKAIRSLIIATTGSFVMAACSGQVVDSSTPDGKAGAGGASPTNDGSGGSAPQLPSGGAGGQRPGPTPEKHRAVAGCDDARAPGGAMAPSLDAGRAGCRVDSDCTNGANGRCIGSRFGWSCSYDQCFADSDCETANTNGHALCSCKGSALSDSNNVCLTVGNCRLDSDCVANGYCSPTLGACGNYQGVQGYYCHTSADECTDDTDCYSTHGSTPYCAYTPSIGHWTCRDTNCVG